MTAHKHFPVNLLRTSPAAVGHMSGAQPGFNLLSAVKDPSAMKRETCWVTFRHQDGSRVAPVGQKDLLQHPLGRISGYCKYQKLSFRDMDCEVVSGIIGSSPPLGVYPLTASMCHHYWVPGQRIVKFHKL